MIVRLAPKTDSKRKQEPKRAAFSLRLEGVSEKEFRSIMHAVNKRFPDCRVIYRNPFWAFTPDTEHVVAVTLVGYLAKKVLDKALEVLGKRIERTLDGSDATHERRVLLYGPDNNPVVYERGSTRKRRS